MSEEAAQPIAQQTPEQPSQHQAIAASGELRAVLLHNDDITPYEYVIELLGALFMLSEEIADHIAMTAHTKGTAVVVVRPRAEAEKLVLAAGGRSRREGYPLTFSLGQG